MLYKLLKKKNNKKEIRISSNFSSKTKLKLKSKSKKKKNNKKRNQKSDSAHNKRYILNNSCPSGSEFCFLFFSLLTTHVYVFLISWSCIEVLSHFFP